MEFIHSNLKFLRKQKEYTQEQMAEVLQIKRSLIGAYEEARAKPNYEILASLAKIFQLRIDDLLLRDLSVDWPQTESQNKPDIQGENLRVLAITVDKKENENIELVPVKAAAGYLSGYGDPSYLKDLNRFRLPFLPSGTYRAFEIKGDSMLPVLPGTIVVGEYVENWKNIKDGQTYIVLSKNDGIVYKRVFNQLKENNSLLLRSDNPTYPAYNIPVTEVLELWRAVLHVSQVNRAGEFSFQDMIRLMQDLKKDVEVLKGN